MPIVKKYKGNRKVLIGLFKKYRGLCCYWGCKTTLPETGKHKQSYQSATIEHIYGNFCLIRMITNQFQHVKLSCRKCNEEKGKQDSAKHYIGYDYREKYDNLLINLLKEKSIYSQ